MPQMLMRIIVLVYMNIVGELDSALLPTPHASKNVFVSKKPDEPYCVLPPYPENGRYIVIGDLQARPGDTLRQATLVRYRAEEIGDTNQLAEVDALACSRGEWFEILRQYDSNHQYFNSSACTELCPDMSTDLPSVSSTVRSEITEAIEQQPSCIIPLNPKNVKHKVLHRVEAGSNESSEALYLRYSCTRNLPMVGQPEIYCFNGVWNDKPPKCITDVLSVSDGVIKEAWEKYYSCTAPRQPKNGMYVVVNSPWLKAGRRKTVMHLRYTCNAGTRMNGNADVYCVNDDWSSKAPACAQCGALGDSTQPEAALPWHVAVYDKKSSPYSHVCGGSIIATNLIVSAAHCFWTDVEGLMLGARFAVAAGKMYRGWDDIRDGFAQKRDVESIAIPPRFRGSLTGYRDDVALLFLAKPLDYSQYVSPLCLDFDSILDERQLKPRNIGRVVLGDVVDDMTPNFRVKDMQYLDVGECITGGTPGASAVMAADKICAGIANGTSFCRRDSGSGLAFPSIGKDFSVTYYLRGVLVAAPALDQPCAVSPVAAFTDLWTHAHFLKHYLDLAIW